MNKMRFIALIALLPLFYLACSSNDDTPKAPIRFSQPVDTTGNLLSGCTHIIAYTENNDIYINDDLSLSEEFWKSNSYTSEFNSANGIGFNKKTENNTYSYLWNNEPLNIYAYLIDYDKSDYIYLENNQLTYTFDSTANNNLYIAEPFVMDSINDIKLKFTSAFTKLSFDFLSDDITDPITITNIKVKTASIVTLDMKTKEVLSTSGNQNIFLSPNLKAHLNTDEKNYKTSLFIAPNMTEVPLDITFTTNLGDQTISWIFNNATTRATELKAGVDYQITILYYPRRIEIGCPIVVDWTAIGLDGPGIEL